MPTFFLWSYGIGSLELQNQADEVTKLEKELKELHIAAENLLEKKTQKQHHLDWSKEQVNKIGQG